MTTSEARRPAGMIGTAGEHPVPRCSAIASGIQSTDISDWGAEFRHHSTPPRCNIYAHSERAGHRVTAHLHRRGDGRTRDCAEGRPTVPDERASGHATAAPMPIQSGFN